MSALRISCSNATLLVLTFALSACGVRTGLMIEQDGSVSADGSTDLGRLDGRVDLGIDATVRCGSDAECEDGLRCNGTDRCNEAGICVPDAIPERCDDGVDCTVDVCAEPTGACAFRPDSSLCVGGGFCDPTSGCLLVGCVPGGGCEDGIFCNGVEICGPDGICQAGTAPCVVGACGAGCDEGSRACTPPMPVDMDGDGEISAFCGGMDCNDRDNRIFPGATELCTNDLDDNCDGVSDCRDSRCAMDPVCLACTPRETVCSGGADEDCDELVDCLDADCDGTPACVATCTPIDVCGNMRDDDCDGPIDCDDPDCARDPSCLCGPGPRPTNEISCTDGVDDDCDGRTDCLDADCAFTVDCDTTCGRNIGSVVGSSVARGTNSRGELLLEGSCSPSTRGGREVRLVWTAPATGDYVLDTLSSSFDTVLYVLAGCEGPQIPGACDDDGGAAQTSQLRITAEAGTRLVIVIDAFAGVVGDYVLSIVPVPTTSERGRCRDGVDNDRDSRADCRDGDCASDSACCAFSPEICGNGADDDCDGFADCEDTGSCAMAPACLLDGGPIDAGRDGGPIDAGRDAGPIDAGRDGGPVDAGRDAGRDAGPIDAGRDGGPIDAGRRDMAMCTAREIGIAACTDGRDGDCDTRADCSDSDCRPLGPMGECCNGIDDDGDGTTDLFTCRCFSNADCVGVGDFEQVCWLSAYQICAPRCNFVGGTAWCRENLGAEWTCNAVSGECVTATPPPPIP